MSEHVLTSIEARNMQHNTPPSRFGAGTCTSACRFDLSSQLGAVMCRDPLVLPYHHSGMGRVLPYKSKWFTFGHDINVVVGE